MKVWLLEVIMTEIETGSYDIETFVFETRKKAKNFIKDTFLTPEVRLDYQEVFYNLEVSERENIVWIDFDVYTYFGERDKRPVIYKNEMVLRETTVI